MAKSLTDKYFSGVIWVLFDKLGTGLINFIITIIFARLLSPSDFGLIAMVMIFFDMSSTLVDSGFSKALVREKEIASIDKSTTFVFNLVIAVFLYGLLFITAPMIAHFFNQEILIWVVRIMGLNLIIDAFGIIQHATLTQQINFKLLAKARLLTVVLSGAIAILMAFQGFGVWSLVTQFCLMRLLNTIFLCIINKWKMSIKFSWESFNRLFNFGSKILLTGLLLKFHQHIYQLLIGRFYSATLLGFYAQANTFKKITVLTLFESTNRVTYPVLSKMQDNKEKLKSVYRKILKMNTFLLVPALVLLGVLAQPFIVTLVGEKWLPSVPMFQLLCVAGITYHFSRINFNLLLAMGRSDLTLKLEIYKVISVTLAVFFGIKYGIYGLIVGEVIASYINMMISMYYSKKYLSYTFSEQVLDVLPTISISFLIGLIIFVFNTLYVSIPLLHLLTGGILGSICYLGLHYIIQTKEVAMIQNLLIPRMKKMLATSN